jgi:hypothetical protein
MVDAAPKPTAEAQFRGLPLPCNICAMTLQAPRRRVEFTVADAVTGHLRRIGRGGDTEW